MYEMEGPRPALAAPRPTGCPVLPAPRTVRQGQTPAIDPGCPGFSHVPGVTPGWCPFLAVSAFLSPLLAAAQRARYNSFRFFSVHTISTECAPLSAPADGYPPAYPPVYAQLIHRSLDVIG